MHRDRLWLAAMILLALARPARSAAHDADAGPARSPQLFVSQWPASGVEILDDFTGSPVDGILRSYRLRLPEFEAVCYYSSDSGWPADANRILPWMAGPELRGLYRKGYRQNPAVKAPSRDGTFALLHLRSGEVLALLPIAGAKTIAWLHVDEAGDMALNLGTLGTAAVRCDAPLIAWGRSPDPYTACREAWMQAIRCQPLRGCTVAREEKTYPDPFRYLGWCSWEQYKKHISSDLLCRAVEEIEASGVPIRWVLVDDGFQTQTGLQLKSFAPDAMKFPQGFAPLLAKRKADKIRWFGLWHCYFGLWKGIATENDLPSLNDDLVLAGNALAPARSQAGAQRFYDALIGSVKQDGFDFVKIDVQAQYLKLVRGLPNPVEMNVWNSLALERACHRDLRGLINCMAHNAACVFHTRHSAVTRCSIDYILGNAPAAASHLFQSYANTLWLGQTVWPDHDEFHSSDKVSGRMMAVSKAMSGAPIYLSDAPQQFVKQYISPLAYEDGELLRPLAPAVPLPDSVFLDALNQPKAYRVIAPLANRCAAVAVYNCRQAGAGPAVQATVSAEDYRHASAMLQPCPGPWETPREGLVLYDWYARKGGRLDASYEVALSGLADGLMLLCPIVKGWAVVGREDKYLAPATIESVACDGKSVAIRMRESGPLVIWLAEGEPVATDLKCEKLGRGLWSLPVPTGIRDYALTVTRR